MISSPVHIARMGFSMQFDFLLSEILDAIRSPKIQVQCRTSDLGCSARRRETMPPEAYSEYGERGSF